MRKIWTLSRNTAKNSTKGTPVARLTGWALVLFVVVIMSIVLGSYLYYWRNYYFATHPAGGTVVVVNAPDSFAAYCAAYEQDNPGDFSYRFVYGEPNVFDVSKWNDYMKQYDSGLVVVFYPDAEAEDAIEVLTFYPIDSLERRDFRNRFVSSQIDPFSTYLLEQEGITVSYSPNVNTDTFPVYAHNMEQGTSEMLQSLALTLIPLVLFIAILYIAMSSGTTTIASAKEQNTFAAVLMTPVPRIKIVLGNILHVWINTMKPVIVIAALCFLIPSYRGGIIAMLLLMSGLALFISSLTVLISVMNETVVSAQTTFLPIFLVFIVLCVTCLQNPDSFEGFYYILPLYGQFLGTGMMLLGKASWLSCIVCCVITLMLSAAIIFVTEKLLHFERFTVSSYSSSDRKIRALEKELLSSSSRIRKVKDVIFGYRPKIKPGDLMFVITQILRPMGLLAFFQFLSLLPPILLTNGEGLTKILLQLKAVNTVNDVLVSSATIVGVFMSTPSFLISMGVGYWLIIAMYVLQVKFFEKEKLSTIGFPSGKIVVRYLAGLLLGFVLMGSIFMILFLGGQIKPTFVGLDAEGVIMFLAYIFMWIPQGATEEIMFRGYMLSRIGARYGKIPAIIASSLLFCLFHGLNPGFSVLAFVNLVLISILYAMIAIKTNHIWTLMAAHTMWNFSQGNLFGLEVSGNVNNAAIMASSATSKTSALWTGGGFGPEGGLAVTIVVIVAMIIVVAAGKKKSH